MPDKYHAVLAAVVILATGEAIHEHGKRKHAEAEAALAKRRFVEMVERGGDAGERTVGE